MTATPFRSRPAAPASSRESRTGSRKSPAPQLNRGPQYRLLAHTTTPDYRIDGDRVHASYQVLTKAALGGRRLAAHVTETFLIPGESPSGRAEIQHIKVRFQPFIQTRGRQ